MNSSSFIEQWRKIPGEQFYEASNAGRIRSLDRVCDAGRRRRGKILKPGVNRHGHFVVSLSSHGFETTRSVHQLVLNTFVGPRPVGLVGRHLNSDPSDNRVSNLEWSTQRVNMLDRNEHGTCVNLNQSRCPRGHLYQEPNLISRDGKRWCKSCVNARNLIRYHAKQGKHLDITEIADRKYALMMPGDKDWGTKRRRLGEKE